MKVIVGSKNPQKIEAVRAVLSTYPNCASLEIEGKETASNVSEQPKSLRETIEGAYNRANGIKNLDTISIGIESGVFYLPEKEFPYNSIHPIDFYHPALDVCACVICSMAQNKFQYNVGLSSAWAIPLTMSSLIMCDGMDMNAAAKQIGLTDDPKIGYGEGAIGLLSEGRLTRCSYTEQAVLAAMIGWHNRFGKLI